MTDNINSLIERKIRKLQQFQSLLQDPDIADVVQSVLQSTPKAAPVAESQPPLTFKKARRRYQRNGGSLIERTLESLREYRDPTTAAELADFMRLNGYKFKARDANISVSKALRQLADGGKIKATRGEHAKAAIVYSLHASEPEATPPTYAVQVPVQETTH